MGNGLFRNGNIGVVLLLELVLIGMAHAATVTAVDLSGVWRVETQYGAVLSDGVATFEPTGAGRYTGEVQDTIHMRTGPIARRFSTVAVVDGATVRIEWTRVGSKRSDGTKKTIQVKEVDGGEKLQGMGYDQYGTFYITYVREHKADAK